MRPHGLCGRRQDAANAAAPPLEIACRASGLAPPPRARRTMCQRLAPPLAVHCCAVGFFAQNGVYCAKKPTTSSATMARKPYATNLDGVLRGGVGGGGGRSACVSQHERQPAALFHKRLQPPRAAPALVAAAGGRAAGMHACAGMGSLPVLGAEAGAGHGGDA